MGNNGGIFLDPSSGRDDFFLDAALKKRRYFSVTLAKPALFALS